MARASDDYILMSSPCRSRQRLRPLRRNGGLLFGLGRDKIGDINNKGE
jgi:hypothetical protein